MSNQFNNQRCSKCYQTYSGLKATCYDSSCNRDHFFKKNGQLFCLMCLMQEGSIKCQKCSKKITRLEEMGKWRRNVVLVDDHTYDINNFGCECRECNHSENEKKKLKRCQGTFSAHYKCKGWNLTSIQYNQCDLAVPIDGGDFCQHCKGQTETYQQLRARLEAEQKSIFEKYCQAQKKAQNWWNTLSSSEREKECERLTENLKLGKYGVGESWIGNSDMEGYGSGWAPDGSFWQIKNGKYVSSQPHLVPCQITEEFYEKMFGDNLSKELVLRDYILTKKDNSDDKDNSPSPNPAATAPQFITNSNEKSGNSASQNNSPQSSQGENSEAKNNAKTIKFENKEGNSEKTSPNSTEKSPNERDNQTLTINLRSIKKITLTPDGNLVIEFKSENSSDSQGTQTITKEQINGSQELQKIKSYLAKSKKKYASQQDLSSILNANSNSSEKPQDSNNILLIVGISGTLIFGIIIGLVLTRKRNIKKS